MVHLDMITVQTFDVDEPDQYAIEQYPRTFWDQVDISSLLELTSLRELDFSGPIQLRNPRAFPANSSAITALCLKIWVWILLLESQICYKRA